MAVGATHSELVQSGRQPASLVPTSPQVQSGDQSQVVRVSWSESCDKSQVIRVRWSESGDQIQMIRVRCSELCDQSQVVRVTDSESLAAFFDRLHLSACMHET